jgi:hypothetical protein
MRVLASTLEACRRPTTDRLRARGPLRGGSIFGEWPRPRRARFNPGHVRASPRKRMRSTLARHFRFYGIRGVLATVLIALSGFASRSALAQPVAGLTIHWDAPPRCPQESDVTERVRKLSGSPTSMQGALQADGTITQVDSGRFHLTLVMRSGGLVGVRNIDSTSCADLTRAAAVAIALLLHSEESLKEAELGGQTAPDGTAEGSEPASTPSAPADDRRRPENTPTVSESPKQTHEPARERQDVTTLASSRSWHIRLRAPLAALSVGPLPHPDWGFAFAVGASYEHWMFSLEGTDWLHQNVLARDFPGYSANVKRAAASLWSCRAQRFSVFEVAPCIVLSFEYAAASGAGQNVAPQSQHLVWISGGVGAQGRVYLASWLSLALSLDGQVEASRPRLSIGGVGVVDQLAPAAFSVMVGPEWIL